MSQSAVQGAPAPGQPVSAAQAMTAPSATGATGATGTAPDAASGTGPSQPQRAAAGRSTPSLLARWRIGVTAACLLALALTTTMLVLSWEATRSAASGTEQLVRVQQIKVNLLRADALATNAFLVGGLEPDSQRAAYQQALVDTQKSIADAAEAQPADRQALAALNAAVLSYAQDMELAGANNRQGFPVGQAYLTVASNGLRSTALPIVDNLVTASQQRTTDDMKTPDAGFVDLPALFGIIVLVLANRWLARRFRRRVNVGVAVASAIVLLGGVAAFAVTYAQSSANDRLTEPAGAYTRVVLGATARSAGNDAKAQESLRLINRGQGAAFEAAWKKDAAVVTGPRYQGSGIEDIPTLWQAYADGHAKIVALDDQGDWDEAVALATSTAADSPGAAFAAFDDYAAQAVDSAATEAVDALRQRLTLLLAVAALVAVAGLVAAAAAWRGVTARLEEYA